MNDLPEETGPGTETVSLGRGSLTPEGELPSGHVVAGRYEVRALLGRGGYGLVYAAVDRRSGHEVALKVLRADRWSEVAVRRFRREAELVRGLHHRRLARVYDTGRDGSDLYLTMERVWGESLRCRLRRGPLPLSEAVAVAAQVAEGLEALHGAGLVHRDVKPANVLLEADGSAKLADFGLTRCATEEAGAVTRQGEAVGTAEYMAPEEALGESLGARSDLYSLGVMLFEMLTGDPPHLGRTPLGTLLAHLQRAAPDVRRGRPDVPPWLARVVARLLARRPEHRYRSARALRADLLAGRARGAGGRPRLRRVATLGCLFALAACTLAVQEVVPRASLREVVSGPEGLTGVGRDGEVLWDLDGLSGGLAAARLKPGEPELLVGVLVSPEERERGTERTLSVLDPATGRLVRTIELASGAAAFAGFADRFGARVAAVDLDDDGLDEVLVSYTHSPYWPSYVVLYEPLLERSRVLFQGSGHHRYAGVADVDGDGRPEVVLVGINNRLGYVPAVAAVRPVPWVNRPMPRGSTRPAASPDAAHATTRGALAWYALLPRRAGGDLDSGFAIDPRARSIRVAAGDGEPVVLSFDGFVTGSPSTLAPAARRASRAEGYARLREAKRLSAAGFAGDAVTEIDHAARLARSVNDPVLAEHARRVQGQILIAAGRHEEASELFGRLAAASDEVPEVAFDAARAFHLAGELERAVGWYRRGLGPGGSCLFGRGKYEFLEGLVFSLEELGRVEEAWAEIARFESSWRSERGDEALEQVALFRDYLRWRSGQPPAGSWDRPQPGQPDVFRYLILELRHARGDAPGELLTAVDAEVARASETVPMLLSLRALLLARLDRYPEAVESARRALREVEHQVDDEIYGRAFRGLVEERAARLRLSAQSPTARAS